MQLRRNCWWLPPVSWAVAMDRPSMAYFVAQYGATPEEVLRPQPEEKLTITPLPRSSIAGSRLRIMEAVPLILMSMMRLKSTALISQSGAGAFMISR